MKAGLWPDFKELLFVVLLPVKYIECYPFQPYLLQLEKFAKHEIYPLFELKY